MAVYVDALAACVPNPRWRWNQSCHLFADTPDELHAFAASIGLKRAWFQGASALPHYDLTVGKRHWAVGLGAVQVDRRTVVEHMRRSR